MLAISIYNPRQRRHFVSCKFTCRVFVIVSTGIVRYHRRSMVVLILAQCNNKVLVGCHVILHKKVINCGKSYGLNN